MIFFKPNTWVCCGGTGIGKSHIRDGIPCQDKIAYNCGSEGLFLALADGLGSKEKSDIGAAIATNGVVSYLRNHFRELYSLSPEEIGEKVVSQIKSLETNYAKTHNCEVDDLKSTLMFIAIQSDRYIYGKIGDGVLGVLNGSEIADILFLAKGPNDGLEYANATYSVLDLDAELQIKINKGVVDNRFDGGFVISDGLPFLSNSGRVAEKTYSFVNLLSNSEFSFYTDMVSKNIETIVSSRDTCIDDWSFIFLKKVTKTQAKSFYTKVYNNIE